MSNTMTWGASARLRIGEAYANIKQVQPDLSDEEICKMISRDYYPFGTRAYWPYKAWLKEMRRFRQSFGIIKPNELCHATPLFDDET